MFLQDLIRNVVIYKGVMRPFIESWREHLMTAYMKQNPHYAYQISDFPLPKPKKQKPRFSLYCNTDLKLSKVSLFEQSGTRTITNMRLLANDNFNIYQGKASHRYNATSNNIITVLTDAVYDEDIVLSNKTEHIYAQTTTDFVILSSLHTYSATTGFTRKNINTFLSLETHEKREYLGEFSLTHEETPLMYLKRGGEEHEINEKPVTTSL